MADWIPVEDPERLSARRAIRHALRQQDAGLVVVSEGFLAADSEIDLLGVGSEGELVSVRFAHAGEDAEGLVRSLSDLTWLRSRAPGLHKLAPGLGMEPSAEPRAVLLCRDFSLDSLSAADHFPKGTLALMRCRWLRQSGQLSALLEPASPPGFGEAPGQSPAKAPPASLEFTLRTGFRTGLSDADLRVNAPDKRPVESITSSD